MGALAIHPAAELFPLMEGDDFAALVADIREHGQRDPITVYQGAILDGRNRYRALLQLERQPMTIEWDGQGTPEEFVASMNLHRRHLSGSQRAMIAARLTTLSVGKHPQSDDLRNRRTDVTVESAARALQVGKTTVNDARRVLHSGTAEEIASIDRGESGVNVQFIAEQIRAGTPPAERRREREVRKANPHSAQTRGARENTQLWQNLKTALLAINNLPMPADMVPVVRAWDRSKITDKHLLRSVNWLQGFAAAWTANNRDAA